MESRFNEMRSTLSSNPATLPSSSSSSSTTTTASFSSVTAISSLTTSQTVSSNSNVNSNDSTSVVNSSRENQLNTSEDDLREWTQTYHMRTLNLLNFPSNASSNRVNYRTVMNRARIGVVTSAAKSLNVLRRALQNSINNEINNVLQKYVERYFKPSITNIKNNFGSNSVSEQHVQAACRQILEEAKKMYIGSSVNIVVNSPLNGELIENGSDYENNAVTTGTKKRQHSDRHHHHHHHHHPQISQLLDCESDSESNSLNNHLRPPPMKKKKLKGSSVGKVKSSGGAGNKVQIRGNATFDIKRAGPRWNPNRLNSETRFVLGSKANKALGFGATRGRLYTKHADLFRYIGDQEDKQWLHEHGFMPPAGGKAYLIIKEDIEDLLSSDEYRGAPGVDGDSMGAGFTVPDNMIEKMKRTMESMRDESARLRSLNGFKAKSPVPLIASESSPPGQNCDASSDVASNNSNQQPGDNESLEPSPIVDLDYLNTGVVSSATPSPFSSLMPTNLSPNPEISSISPLPTDLSLTSSEI